jgi:hypothetical protein
MSDEVLQELNDLLANSDKLWITRKRKINTKILFDIMSKVIAKNNGIKHVISYDQFNNQNYDSISDAAICKARNKCDPIIFDNIKKSIISKFNNNKNIFAVDGSKFHLPDSYSELGFTTRSPKSKKILGMISTIYDITSKIPLNTLLCKHHNERLAITQQLNSIPKGSILIFDRGYYSKDLVKTLERNNIRYLFRLKRDANNSIKKFYRNNKNINKTINVGNHKMRLFKYFIDGKQYLCGTNINSSINRLKKLYKLRWSVEEGFKIMKSRLSFKKIHSKSEILLKQEISIRELLFVVSRFIQITTKITKKFKRKHYSPSFKLIIDFIISFDTLTLIDMIYDFNIILCSNQHITVPNRRRI